MNCQESQHDSRIVKPMRKATAAKSMPWRYAARRSLASTGLLCMF